MGSWAAKRTPAPTAPTPTRAPPCSPSAACRLQQIWHAGRQHERAQGGPPREGGSCARPVVHQVWLQEPLQARMMCQCWGGEMSCGVSGRDTSHVVRQCGIMFSYMSPFRRRCLALPWLAGCEVGTRGMVCGGSTSMVGYKCPFRRRCLAGVLDAFVRLSGGAGAVVHHVRL